MKLDVDFEPEKHVYTVNGERWPSVTTILKPLVEAEYRHADADAMKRASVLGTYLALAIELDLAGTLDENDLDERLLPRFKSWRDFRAKSGFEPLLCETVLTSTRHRYCGKLDLFGRLKRRLVLIDAKATCAIVRTVRPQTAGYAVALCENPPSFPNSSILNKVDPFDIERYALHLPEPPAKWKLVRLDDRADFRVFLARATLHHNWEHVK